ncbi:gamma-glutamylcyclotransferase family protein [Thiohalorhabdus sp.]|uniref:gamma-glutamylcyclotransferase family protein n=1 Tax=Thiohalorhabdus sp. TaxID=3094134 RepID=UPI002FC34922
MSELHYLAFGSNLHPFRLGERVPSARLLGRVELTGYRLAFHKLGADGSGKGNLVHTGRESDIAVGALFEMAGDEKPKLDAVEGAGYRDDTLAIHFKGKPYDAFVYIGEAPYIDPDLRPYDWYRDLSWHGARFNGASSPYLAQIAAVEAAEDSDPERRQRNRALVERIQKAGSR